MKCPTHDTEIIKVGENKEALGGPEAYYVCKFKVRVSKQKTAQSDAMTDWRSVEAQHVLMVRKVNLEGKEEDQFFHPEWFMLDRHAVFATE
jgi:ABC-type proline/glycine betaine transport system ATPase subunit